VYRIWAKRKTPIQYMVELYCIGGIFREKQKKQMTGIEPGIFGN
jgi:hypothetical protein